MAAFIQEDVMENPATTGKPIHDLIRRRWSPRAFSERPVGGDILAAVFEAGRWAASCFNDQPWRYLVATKADAEAHARMGSVLVPGNAWAHKAWALVLSTARLGFERNGKPNLHAWHDVGAASAMMSLEAVNQGLCLHQMAGFDREKARGLFGIPEGWEPVAMIAIGYAGSLDHLPEEQKAAEARPRVRKPMPEIVHTDKFGVPFDF